MACCVSFLPLCAGTVCAQDGANDTDVFASVAADAVSSLLDSLKLTDDQQQRLDAARSVFETVKSASNTVKSLEDLFRKRELSLPVGVGDGEKYLICINEIYSDKDGNSHLKVSCIIPLNESGKQLAFDGEAIVEGQNGVGTRGRIELVAPLERKLGGESSVIFKAGTAVEFGCNGFEKLTAKLAFALKSSTIQAIDAAGKRTGRLRADMEADIDDIDNFTVSFGINNRFVMKGLDNYIFSISGATLDQSYTQTSAMVSFPDGYFEGGTDDDRNMWRGLAISQAEVQLPDFMSHQDTTKAPTPTRLSLSGVIIDGAGFSCHAAAQNVTSNSVKSDSWDLSVSDFEISLLRNQVKGVTFGGKINVPPLGESSKLDYAASLNIETNNYSIEAALPDSAEFPMFSGALEIASNSTVRVEIDGNKIKPELNLNGTISINAAIGNSQNNNRLTLPDIEFQQMRISPTDFSLGHVGLTGKLQTPNVAGFQLTVSEISSFETDDSTSAGLAVTAGVHVAEKFTGEAGLRLYGNIQKWKFSDVEIGKIHIGYEQNAFSLAGGIEFRSGDDIYGRGFRGDVKMKLLNGQLQVDAVAVFGKKDNYRYFLTDAFLETTPAKGVKVSFLNFYGVGGGLYSKMQQQRGKATCDFGESLSKINYVPDKDVSIGLMARTKFGFSGSDKLMDADVGLEIQFNKNWGVNFIQLRGDATFVCKDLGAGLAQSIKSNMDKIEGASKGVVEFKKEQLAEPKNDGVLRASMGMMFDIENETFTSDLKAYLNVGDMLRGSGPNDQLGFANIYVSKDKWYTYIGTPKERCGVKLFDFASASSYFMMGDDIPTALPVMPDKIQEILSFDQKSELENRPDASTLSSGKGIAMGVRLDVDINADLKLFYASLGLGMGTEFLLNNYGQNAHCKGSSDPIGINGWFAQAQAWAWVDANIGMRVKLLGKERKYNIIKGEMASYMKGSGPNPFSFTGIVGGHFELLNGLVKGECKFDFQVGKECEFVDGNPLGEDVIAQITPGNGTSDIDVFVAPQLVLNVPAGVAMELKDGTTYRVDIDEFTITNVDDNKTLKATKMDSEDKLTFTYDLEEPLESQKKHKVHAKVSFKMLSGGKWVDVKDENNKPFVEEKTAEFKSGDRPNYIKPEHVAYSYPADRQYNFYSAEHSEVYLLVTQNYSYLFDGRGPKGYDQVLQLSTIGGSAQTTNLNFTTSPRQTTDSKVKFELYANTANLSFEPDKIYNLAVINKPKQTVTKVDANVKSNTTQIKDANSDFEKTTHSAEGTIEMLETTMIYEADFRTSAYSTFKAKMAQMTVGSTVASQIEPHVHNLKTNIIDNCTPTENFDFTEYENYTGNGIIKINPVYSQTPWYENSVKPLMYGNTDLRNLIGSITPPTNDSIIYWYGDITKLSDNAIETNNSQTNAIGWNVINNYMQEFIDKDLYNYRTTVAYKLVNGAAKTTGVQFFLNANNIPPTEAGMYPILFEYTLPGKNIKTSDYQINVEYK